MLLHRGQQFFLVAYHSMRELQPPFPPVLILHSLRIVLQMLLLNRYNLLSGIHLLIISCLIVNHRVLVSLYHRIPVQLLLKRYLLRLHLLHLLRLHLLLIRDCIRLIVNELLLLLLLQLLLLLILRPVQRLIAVHHVHVVRFQLCFDAGILGQLITIIIVAVIIAIPVQSIGGVNGAVVLYGVIRLHLSHHSQISHLSRGRVLG